MGKAIASIFSGKKEVFKSHIVIGDIAVTWAFGHVFGLQEAHEYDPVHKKWALETLPIIPAPFVLKPSDNAADQIAAIKMLLKETSLVIHAGDPDREGQMIIDEILSEMKFKGKVKRMMPNSADEVSVKKSYAAMVDNKKYRPLFEAAMCRAQADWMIGINLTRAVSLGLTASGRTLVTIGRVQTPALALLVARDNLIDAFVSKAYYKLEATVKCASGKTVILNCDPQDDLRIWFKQDAEAVASKLTGAKVNLSVSQTNASQAPPKLFNTLGFCGAIHQIAKITPKTAAGLLQLLYDAPTSLTTYPRTEHEKLPAELKSEALMVAKHLVANEELSEFNAVFGLMSPRDSNYTLPKTAEHHAIIPTVKSANTGIPSGCNLAYFVIARRFLLSLLPDYKFKSTVISFVEAPYSFTKKGDVGLNLTKSWKIFEKSSSKQVELLPDILDGESGNVVSVLVIEGKTTPPKRYNAFTLMEDMSAVAKFVDDPKQKRF